MPGRSGVLKAAIAIGVVALVGYGVGSYLLYDTVTSVTAECSDRDDGTPRFSENTPAGWTLANPDDVDDRWAAEDATLDIEPYRMPDYETVAVPSRDPTVGPLAAWWVPGRTADSPAVVVVHGFGSCRRDHVVLLPAGMLHRAGFGVLLIDMRDMGDSPVQDGRFAGGTQEYLDVLGARDWLVEEQGLRRSQVGILGTSLGAATVVIAAGEDDSVAATWEDSSYGDAQAMIGEEIAYKKLPGFVTVFVPGGMAIARVTGIDPTSKSPLEEIASVGARPLAIVHGERDPRIAAYHARDLADVVARSVPGFEPWIVPCAVHVEAAYCATAEYESRLVSFFTDALGAP